MTDAWYEQTPCAVRFEWGPEGARRLARGAACLVVVDVLSFTTAVSVAVDGGARVHPYAWRDASAAAYARSVGAELAVGRRMAGPERPWSLSPAALRAAPAVERLVLPSPNGSAIAAAAGDLPVVAASLRNAAAVARWLARQGYGTAARPVAVVAAGERWPDGGLRPALEDLLGAGAVIAALRRYAGSDLSPEARTAVYAYEGTPDPRAALADCASGRELARSGFAEDVTIAAELDASGAAPVLTDGAFTDRVEPTERS